MGFKILGIPISLRRGKEVEGHRAESSMTPRELYGLDCDPLKVKVISVPGSKIWKIPTDGPGYGMEVDRQIQALAQEFPDDTVLVRHELDPNTGKLVEGDAYTRGRSVLIVVPKSSTIAE